MAQTLRTGDFSLRALPVTPRIDPANFDAQLGQILNLYTEAMQVPAKLEQVRATQRAGEIGRATQPQNLELAKAQAAQNLELLPYETATKKRAATKALDQPGGSALYYDDQGNLVQDTVTIETDPITGEQVNVSVPNVIKTAQQVAMERESASALSTQREASARAAEERAKAATTTAEASKARAENDRLKIQNAMANKRSFRMFKNTGFGGKTVGFVATVFDPITGEFINQELNASGQPIGEAYRSKAEPQGELVQDTTQAAPANGTVQPFLGGSAGQSATTPALVAPPAQAADLAALAANYPTPQALVAAIRSGQITPAQGREIARLNKFE